MMRIIRAFAVKNLSELNSSGWLKGKKETIISGDKDFENALYDALNYQTIEKDPQRISKLKPYINNYNWEDRISGRTKRVGKI